MTKLSVNINKIAVVRNSRGGNLPDVVRAATDIERFGADGITVHPRPDARHIRYDDVRNLARVLTTEFNIEGNPIPDFVALVLEVRPAQVTLVPDAPDAITSNAGWNTVAHREFLTGIAARFRERGIRVSIFVDPVPEMVAGSRSGDRPLPGRRRGSPPAGTRAQRRARPLAGEPALLRRPDSRHRRGVDRPRADLRRALLRTGEHRAALQTGTQITRRP